MLTLPDLSVMSWTVLSLTLCLAAFVRGYAGFGAGLLLMPVASSIVGPTTAVAFFFLADVFLSLPLIPNAMRKADWPTVTPLLIFAWLGVPAGTFVLLHADAIIVRWATTLIVALLLALLVSGWRYHNRPTAPVSALVGFVSGVLGGLAQVAGPPVVAYWMSGPSKSETIRANLISFFALLSIGTAIAFVTNRLFTPQVIGLAIIFAPAYALFMWLGARAFRPEQEQIFRKLTYALIAISAITSMPALDAWLRP